VAPWSPPSVIADGGFGLEREGTMVQIGSTLRLGLVVVACSMLTGCPPTPPGPGPDTTPPSFTGAVVRVESPTPPVVRGEFDIRTADVNRSQLAPEITLRIIASAGDPQSGISRITVTSELRFRCAFGRGSQTIGVLEQVPLVLTPAITPPAAPLNILGIDAVANPVAQTGCDMSSPGKGPVDISGFIRVTATNGATPPATVVSKTFLFDYADIGVRR
jgi:hypothetical protein